VRVLLVSTYELGHQPLHVASPAAALERAGHAVRCLDLSVEPFDDDAVAWAEAVGFSVPMHTAMRLALPAARRVRRARPTVPMCFYGLYAAVSRSLTTGGLAQQVIAGEYERALVAWVDERADRATPSSPSGPDLIELGRSDFCVPARHLLPPLERYAHLAVDGEERLVGYVEASHGCVHRCRHCPVPVVYDGRIRIVGERTVLADVAQLVDMGARHITFGDPDFLNGVHHSLRVVRAVHERFPELTFDCTTKVEHILRHESIWPGMADAGCLFVVSAFESVNDAILERLDKGHSAADAAWATALLRRHGIEVRPSFLPFTPWTTAQDVLDLLDFVADHDLVGNVDPVQYTIRLLLPEGSLLLDHPDLQAHLGAYDPEGLGYAWVAADPAVDVLQARLSSVVEASLAAGEPVSTTFLRVREAVVRAVPGHPGQDDTRRIPLGSVEGRPRLTEPWFC
jgi:radical SAM superfamily enzyme YgiQ (UPF0313 family)